MVGFVFQIRTSEVKITPALCPLVSRRMNECNLIDPHDVDVIKRSELYINLIKPQNPLPFTDGSCVFMLEAVFDRTF